MKKALLLISALILSGGASAQTDSKNAVVNVENDYNPEVIEVRKKDFTPSVDSKVNTKPMTLEFSKTGKAYNGFTSERNITDALLKKEEPFPGYARLGYGLTNDIDAKLAYRLGVGKNGTLKAYAGFDGYKSDVNGLFDKWNSRLFKTMAGIGYTHSFKNITLGVDGTFKNNVFNYQCTDVAKTSLSNNQDGQNYWLAISGESNLSGPISYKFKGDFEYIARHWSSGKRATIGEGRYGIGGNIGYELLSEWVKSVGIDLNFDAFTYNSTLRSAYKGYDNYFSIDINPHSTLKFDKWTVKAGIKMNIITRGEGTFAIAPDIKAESQILENISVYGSITGGRTNNSFAKLESITPYWGFTKNGGGRLKPTYRIVDINIGSRISFEPVSISVNAGYAYTKDDLLEILHPESIDQFTLMYANFGQDNTHHAYVDLHLGCDLRSWVKLSADARYDFWNCSDNNLLIMKPQITVDVNAEARIIENLTLRMGYNFTRYTESATRGRINNKNDLYARISYQITKRYGAYIQGNNLLNSQYFDYAGYATRGIRASLGATVNF